MSRCRDDVAGDLGVRSDALQRRAPANERLMSIRRIAQTRCRGRSLRGIAVAPRSGAIVAMIYDDGMTNGTLSDTVPLGATSVVLARCMHAFSPKQSLIARS